MDLATLARQLLPFLKSLLQTSNGTSVVGGAPSPHGLNSPHHSGTLANSQAPQFLLLDGSRALTGNLGVNPGITIDGVDLSAHAADPNAHHDTVTLASPSGLSLAGQVISIADSVAGAGLTISSKVLAVGAGAGITVNANDVTLNLGSPSGLTFSGSALVVDDAIAGAGLTIASKVLAVGAGNGLTVNANDVALTTPGTLTVATANNAAGNHTHAITSSSNPGAAASLLASNASGYLQLVRLGAGVAPTVPLQARATTEQMRLDYDAGNYAAFTVNASGALTLAPTGDLILNPTGLDVLPQNNFQVNVGAINKKYLTGHFAELWVQTFVAEETIATIGGHVVVAPTTKLINDVDSLDTVIQVEHNLLSNGDRAWFMSGGKLEFMAITSSYTPVSGGYEYTVTRNLDGTGANDWYAGDAAVNTGTTSSGFIELYSQESVNGIRFDYIFVYDASANSYTANLADQANFEMLPTTGASGDMLYLAFVNKQWTNAFFDIAIAGAWTSLGDNWEYWNGAAWVDLGETSTPNLKATGLQTLSFTAPGGWAPTAVNGITAFWVRFRIPTVTGWTTTPKHSNKHVIMGKAQWGPTIVGWVRNSGTFNDLSEAWAIGAMNGLYGYSDNTFGVGLGKYGTGSENYVTFDATNGIRFFSGTTVRAQLSSTTWTLGVTTADHVRVTTSGVQLKDNTTVKFDAQTDGDLFIGSNVANAADTYFSIFANAQTYNSESVSAGDMLIGDNSASKANIFWDKSAGQLLFRGGTTTQAYVDTNGAIVAGGGNVTLDSNGLTIVPGVLNTNNIKWISGGVDVVTLKGQSSTTHDFIVLAGDPTPNTNPNGKIALTAYNPSAADSVTLTIDGGSLSITTESPISTTTYLFVNESSNANMSKGITINQGSFDDQILAFKSSDTTHGVTTLAETDTFAYFQKISASNSGLQVVAFRETAAGSVTAIQMRGIGGDSDTARATTAVAAIVLDGALISGTGTTNLAANGNLFAVRDVTSTRFLVDKEGDIHMDATSNINAWDEYDDMVLLAGVREAMNPGLRLQEFVEDARPVLERTGVVSYNPDGHHFISLKKLHALEIDAMRQLYQRIERLEKELEALR